MGRTVGLLAERRGVERKNCYVSVLLGLDPRSHRRQGLHHRHSRSGALVAAHRARRHRGTFFVLVAFVTNTIASQDGDDFSTDEILAELTGEAPKTAPPAPAEEKGFELPAFELPKLPNPFE